MQQNMVPLWDQLPQLSWKEKVALLHYHFQQFPQAPTPVNHCWQDGKYYRTMHIPAGTLFLGRAHRVGHEVQLLEGSVVLKLPDGDRIHNAPDSLMSTPGFHTVFQALTDVVGRTVHPDTGERNVDVLEREIFEPADALTELGAQIHQRLLT